LILSWLLEPIESRRESWFKREQQSGTAHPQWLKNSKSHDKSFSLMVDPLADFGPADAISPAEEGP